MLYFIIFHYLCQIKTMQRYLQIIFIVGLVWGLSGCSSHKQTVATSPVVRHEALTMSTLEALGEKYQSWETLYVPFTMRCEKPVSMSISGRATMVRDSYVHMSMRMLGFEVAVVYIDNDSVVVADKYHKIVVSEPIDALTARTGLTLGNIQDLLLGRAIYPGVGLLGTFDDVDKFFKISFSDTDGAVVVPRKAPLGATWSMALSQEPSLMTIILKPDGKPDFRLSYSDFRSTEGGDVASEFELTGMVSDKQIEAACQWNFSKARWNQSVSEPSVSFSSYRRLSAADLIGAFKNYSL